MLVPGQISAAWKNSLGLHLLHLHQEANDLETKEVKDNQQSNHKTIRQCKAHLVITRQCLWHTHTHTVNSLNKQLVQLKVLIIFLFTISVVYSSAIVTVLKHVYFLSPSTWSQ